MSKRTNPAARAVQRRAKLQRLADTQSATPEPEFSEPSLSADVTIEPDEADEETDDGDQ